MLQGCIKFSLVLFGVWLIQVHSEQLLFQFFEKSDSFISAWPGPFLSTWSLSVEEQVDGETAEIRISVAVFQNLDSYFIS